MLKTYKSSILALSILSFIYGCAPLSPQKTAAEHQQELASTQEKKTTLGLFQASIKEGMSQGDVAAAVGAPNIVTQDSEGNDTWIYDKISTETSQSASSQQQDTSVGVGLGAFGTLLGGVMGASQSQGQSSNASATSQSQKTLTVVLKFDKNRNVSRIRYQSSSF